MKTSPLPSCFPDHPTVIFTDVDDTLTWEGKLPNETFSAMFKLKEHGITLIPVTGACAGWCDCMVRTWPISSIIGENGAFYIERNTDGSYSYFHALDERERKQNWQRLQRLKKDTHETFSQARQTADQPFRLNDIAFDIGQDYQVNRQVAHNIAEFCKANGAQAKISSIHINVWLGEYSKSLTAMKWLKEHSMSNNDAIFIGDSPNDEDMFSCFDTTIGVANIKPFLDELNTVPTYVTSKCGGYGFAEFTQLLLE